MIEVIHQINAVQRQVGTRALAAGEARTITISQSYHATIDDLWDACTKPERIARWFLPVSGELVAGGRFQIEGNASGTVQRCDPPKSFAATWEYGEETSWIEVRLTAQAQDRTGHDSSLSTSLMLTTSAGPNSALGRSASAGTWASWAWLSTCHRDRPSTTTRVRRGRCRRKASSS